MKNVITLEPCPRKNKTGFNNTGEYLITGFLHDTTGMIVRPALSLDGMQGGLIEYYFPEGINVSDRIVFISAEKVKKPF